MRELLAIAALVSQMTMGVCVFAVGSAKAAECVSPCCEHALPADGSMSNACCRLTAPALPALEASSPFTATAPSGPAMVMAPATVGPPIVPVRGASLGRCSADTSPPRLYLRNSTLLI